jgi:hypothetical protein
MLMHANAEDDVLVVDLALTEALFGSPNLSLKQHGEYRLLWALLEDAIHCFQRHSRDRSQRARRLAHDAEAWIFSDDRSWPVAFLNVCAVLDLNAEYIREGLCRWRQQHLDRLSLKRWHLPPRKAARPHSSTNTRDRKDNYYAHHSRHPAVINIVG